MLARRFELIKACHLLVQLFDHLKSVLRSVEVLRVAGFLVKSADLLVEARNKLFKLLGEGFVCGLHRLLDILNNLRKRVNLTFGFLQVLLILFLWL